MSFYNVSATADDNSTIASISALGTASANVVDNLIRQLAAQDKQFLLDIAGANAVGGTANAITVTPASGSITAAFDGLLIGFIPTAANTSATVTAAVGGLGAEPVKKAAHGAEASLAIGDIQAGALYILRWRSDWDSSGGAWELVQLSAGAGSYTTTTAATSGSEVAFTGIPAGISEVKIILDEVSTNGTAGAFIQLGTSSGYETTGYVGGRSTVSGSAVLLVDVTNGAPFNLGVAARYTSGVIYITRLSTTKWKIHGSAYTVNPSNPTSMDLIFSSKTLTGELDRVRVVPGGSDTFDGSGSIKIIY